MDFYRAGLVKPIEPRTLFQATAVKNAIRQMQRGNQIGKIVVAMPEQTDELASVPSRRRLSLRGDRAYLFVGGLGGLGRSVATWLVEHGARHLVFMSRSAGKIPDSDPFMIELAAMACSVVRVSGDVTVYGDVEKAINASDLPIGGVLQSSMVLQVCLLPN